MGKSLDDFCKEFSKPLKDDNFTEGKMVAGKLHARAMQAWYIGVLYKNGYLKSPTYWGVSNFSIKIIDEIPRRNGKLFWDYNSIKESSIKGIPEVSYWWEISKGYNKWYTKLSKVKLGVIILHGKVVFKVKNSYNWDAVMDARYGIGSIDKVSLDEFYKPFEGEEDIHVAEIRKTILEYIENTNAVFISDEFIYTKKDNPKQEVIIGFGCYEQTPNGIETLDSVNDFIGISGEFVTKFSGVQMGISGFDEVLPIKLSRNGKLVNMYPVDEIRGGETKLEGVLSKSEEFNILSTEGNISYKDALMDIASHYYDTHSLYIVSGWQEYQDRLLESNLVYRKFYDC